MATYCEGQPLCVHLVHRYTVYGDVCVCVCTWSVLQVKILSNKHEAAHTHTLDDSSFLIRDSDFICPHIYLIFFSSLPSLYLLELSNLNTCLSSFSFLPLWISSTYHSMWFHDFSFLSIFALSASFPTHSTPPSICWSFVLRNRVRRAYRTSTGVGWYSAFPMCHKKVDESQKKGGGEQMYLPF